MSPKLHWIILAGTACYTMMVNILKIFLSNENCISPSLNYSLQRYTKKTQSKPRHLPGIQMINVTKVDELWYDSSYSLILYMCTQNLYVCIYGWLYLINWIKIYYVAVISDDWLRGVNPVNILQIHQRLLSNSNSSVDGTLLNQQ